MGTRRRGREEALQVLYQIDVTKETPEHAMRVFWEGESSNADVEAFARTLVGAVEANRERIDELIGQASTNWKIGRMSFVDRNILRIAVAEFLACDDVPTMVSMNEAIEVGKRYGTTESSAFINGILDRVARTLGLTGPK